MSRDLQAGVIRGRELVGAAVAAGCYPHGYQCISGRYGAILLWPIAVESCNGTAKIPGKGLQRMNESIVASVADKPGLVA